MFHSLRQVQCLLRIGSILSIVLSVYQRPVIVYTPHGDSTFLPFSKKDEEIMDPPPIIVWLRALHFNAIVATEEETTRVQWPRLYPAYESFVENYDLSSKWLDLYIPRCKK